MKHRKSIGSFVGNAVLGIPQKREGMKALPYKIILIPQWHKQRMCLL